MRVKVERKIAKGGGISSQVLFPSIVYCGAESASGNAHILSLMVVLSVFTVGQVKIWPHKMPQMDVEHME